MSNTKQARGWRAVLAMVAFAVAAIAGLGCATGPVMDTTPRPIPTGTLVNRDVTIIAEDGSFQLQPGEQFPTPFATSALWNASIPANTLVNTYTRARSWGARPVIIRQAGKADLHGLLLFNNAIAAAVGPGSQSYYVNLPQDKLDNARRGNTTVVYEMMRYNVIDEYGTSQQKDWYSWILWMSSTPL
ncbi:hypothetical protein [Arenimonas composti]|uniref:Uncharacterized protein n=1 Tax=Arenimonas composti TR7-09 = DSM 18010 TaxID=1121013 RepID=A0A091B7D1_9GAMM|nr:hypothetical protein [Arenimonas composti]KFN47397.1 hypothetical protein P873_01780 [Arenimonas composti TR7-09 = DSM 18010]